MNEEHVIIVDGEPIHVRSFETPPAPHEEIDMAEAEAMVAEGFGIAADLADHDER